MSLTHQWLFIHEHRAERCLRTWNRDYTWAECCDEVRRAAGALAEAGIVTGDVVAVQLAKGPEFWFLHLALLGLGAVTMPLNPAYTPSEVAWMLQDAGARLAIGIDPSTPTDVARWGSDGLGERLKASAPHPLAEVPALSKVGVICYTSGTTGRPKGARIRQSNIAACVDALHTAWGWRADDVLIHALPLFHVHGLFVAQHGALRAGALTCWLPRFEAAALLGAIEQEQGTVVMGVPTFYTRLLAHGLAGRTLDSVRLFTSGSAPLPAATWEAFRRATGRSVVERYGMTEVGIVVSNPLDATVPGTIGFPLAGVRARMETEGRTSEVGEVGELFIAGPSVFEGYHNRPEATAEALVDGWMRTGDLGWMDKEGRITLVGRRSEMVISGGLNVYPAEVEAAVVRHPEVAEAAVFGVPDADLGEQVRVAVVAESPLDPSALRGWLREHLAGYKIPKQVHQVDVLPRNAMGKVTKQVLKDRFA